MSDPIAVRALPRAACALVVAVCAVAGAVAPAHAARSPELVLIDANADGDTPVSRGLIQVDRCGRRATGASLRQSNGARAERTNSAGAALLTFDRLPRCFVVRVLGGRANGRTVRGSFRAQARNQPDQVMSVLVTPVSTLTHAVRRARPGTGRARATRFVQRLLGIPSHFDDSDLAADDRPFDGDRYLAAAVRAGGVAKLNRALLRAAQRNRRHSFRTKRARAAAAPLGDDPLGLREWWNQTDVTKLVKDGLKDFGLSLVSEGLQVGGKWVLGRLLEDWGLKEGKELLVPDTEKIIEMIQELTKRVNDLQETADTTLKEVLAGQYDAATQPTVPIIDAVDTSQDDIVNLLKLKQDDPGRVGATKRILESIAKLEGQRNRLNLLLTNPIPGVTNILVAASKKAATQDRWFRQAESQSVRDVYKYYAVYQLRLANLLVEYWNTRSCAAKPVPEDCLSPTTIQFDLDKFDTNIDRQKAQLKPALPAGTFIDRRTMRMWPQASWPLNGQDALSWTAQWVPRTCPGPSARSGTCTGSAESPYLLPLKTTGLSLPALGPWTDWKFPSEDDYRELIDGWKGDSPLAWLNQRTGFATTTMTRENDQKRLSGHMWLGNSFRPSATGLYVYRVNLSEQDRPGPHVWYQRTNMPSAPRDRLVCTRDGRTCSEPLSQVNFNDLRDNYTAQMLLWRPVQSGDYWWP